MRKFLLTAVALGGLFAITGAGANAAPVVTAVQTAPTHANFTQVDYYWHHHHWHHRHWDHDHWRYYD